MRINALLALVFLAVLVGHAEHRAQAFIVRTVEHWTTLKPTAGPNNLINCLIVYPDGRLHLELRRQEFLDGRRVELTTYESALDSKGIEYVRSILHDAAVTKLRPFINPVVPMSVDDWQGFTAEIVNGALAKRVGYLSWHGEGPRNPESDKTAWKEAAVTLEPLVEWSRSLKVYAQPKWRQVRNPKTNCGQ